MAVGKPNPAQGDVPQVKGLFTDAPGGVKKRAKVPARQKGTKAKSSLKGNVGAGKQTKSLKTTAGNRRAGYTTTGIMKPYLG